MSVRYYSGHKESNNLNRDIVILRVLCGAELTSQSAFERNIQPAWQSLKLLTRRYLNSGQGNMYENQIKTFSVVGKQYIYSRYYNLCNSLMHIYKILDLEGDVFKHPEYLQEEDSETLKPLSSISEDSPND